jgi:hypothetical protein
VHERIVPAVKERHMVRLNHIETNTRTLHGGKKNLAVGIFLEPIQLGLAMLRVEIAIEPNFEVATKQDMSNTQSTTRFNEEASTYRAQFMFRSSTKIPSSMSNPPLKKLRIKTYIAKDNSV